MTSVKVQRSPSVYELQWHKRVMTLEWLPCDYLLLEKHWPDIKPKRTERIKWGQQILLISDKMEARGGGDPPSGHFRPDAAIRRIEEENTILRGEKERKGKNVDLNKIHWSTLHCTLDWWLIITFHISHLNRPCLALIRKTGPCTDYYVSVKVTSTLSLMEDNADS